MSIASLMAWVVLLFCGNLDRPEPQIDQNPLFEWSRAPALPFSGVSGPFGGVIENKIILAGGNTASVNGEDEAGTWSDQIVVLDLERPENGWSLSTSRLVEPLAYGCSITLPDGSVLLVGGTNGVRHFASSSLLRLTDGGVHLSDGPELPIPLAYMSSALVGDQVFIVGGMVSPSASSSSNRVFSLEWSSSDARWTEVQAIPGDEGRMLSSTASHGGSLYVFGGCRVVPGGTDRLYLDDSWRFTPDPQGQGEWMQRSDLPIALAAGPVPCPNIGSSFIIVGGGSDRPVVRGSVHSGALLAYDVITDAWSVRSGSTGITLLNTPTLSWEDRYIFPGGEEASGVRSREVLVATPAFDAPRFTVLDWIALSSYLVILVLLGVYFARRDQTTEDFFLGGRRVPWWAAGISIFATQLSAITFMAIPAKSYSSDWTLFIQSLGIFAMAPVVAYLFLPFFRRLNIATAYEYLERRFSLIVRLFGSAQYLLFQFGRMAVVVYLPAIALSAVTGFEVHSCILLMGVLCIIYTVLGGIEAVIWSDVIQAFVLLGGALLILYGCITGVDGGILELYARASESDRLRMADLDWDFTRASLPVVILGGIFINLVPYASDQSVVQRYLTTPDERSARKAIWLGGIISIPASLLFFGLGTALFGFYEANPERLAPLAKTDQIVPWFLVNEIPSGLAGLVIAGIFAAAMSSLDSSMNSSATVLINDFYRRLRRSDHPVNESRELQLARVITVILGSLGTLAALLLASFPAESVFDQWLELVGLFASGLCGLFVLGIFSRRPGTPSAIIGVLSSIAVLLVLKEATNISGLLYAAVGTLTCVVVGWISSLVLPSQGEPHPGTSFLNRNDPS